MPKDKKVYLYFSLGTALTTIATLSLDKNIYLNNLAIINSLQFVTLVIAVAFLCHDLWYKNLKDEHIGIIFYLSITALAFTSSFLVLASKFSQGSIIIFIIHIAMIGFLLSWKATLLVLTLGLYGAFKYYEYCFNGGLLLSEIEEVKLKIIYILFIIFIFFITFFKNRQEVYELVEEKSHYLELKVIDQKNELVKLQEFKNELLQNIEHEMRTPITGITSLGQVLWDNYDKFNEEQRRNATRDIAQSSERLTSLVNNLIDLSKLRNLDYNLNKSEINLSELVLKRLEICQKLYMNEKNREDLNFEVEVEDKLSAFCDEHYITRTIDNIIINAIQYCPKGQITVKLHKNSGEEIEFSVKDEGIGIPEEELHEVFGAFIVSSRTKTPAGGRGIGLALCKKVIKAHKGEIWAKQNLDKGTIFTFTLPRNNKD